MQRADDRSLPTNSGIRPYFVNLPAPTVATNLRLGSPNIAAKPMARSNSSLDDLIEIDESTTTDEENVRGVDLNTFLLRMLASPLRECWRLCLQ